MVELLGDLMGYYSYFLALGGLVMGVKIMFLIQQAMVEERYFGGMENFDVENKIKRYLMIYGIVVIIPSFLRYFLMSVL